MVKVIEPVETMQLICKQLTREQHKTIRLVPTMGSLHAGHASLIKRAIEDNDDADDEANDVIMTSGDGQSTLSHTKRRKDAIVIVSIFVNPLQFNDNNDFAKYPISTQQDLNLCKQLNVDFVFMPKSSDILATTSTTSMSSSKGRQNNCSVKPPDECARDLEGQSRGGGHFEGVLTIVCKLFNIIQPSRAYFGEKDYQQLVLVDKMVGDLNMPVKICPVPIVRETHTQLPLSSRNVRLTLEQQQVAAMLMYETLISTKQSIESRARCSEFDDRNGCSDSESTTLDTIILSSLLAAQCLLPPENELHLDPRITATTTMCDQTIAPSSMKELISVDYLELRCAKDLSVIKFDQTSNVYDCQRACMRTARQSDDNNDDDDDNGGGGCRRSKSLAARLLMSIIVANVRLLDNIEVRLNLCD